MSAEPRRFRAPRPLPRTVAAALGVAAGLGLIGMLASRLAAPPRTPPPGELHFLPNDRVRLFGRARLLVGDSMCVRWPGDAHDVVAFSMMPAGVIRRYASGFLADMDHAEIVFWVGTAHFWYGHPEADFWSDLRALVALAGDRPYAIVGPLCPRGLPDPVQAIYASVNARLAAEYPAAYVDPAAVLEIPGPGERYLADMVHLTPDGYAALAPAVEAKLRAAD